MSAHRFGRNVDDDESDNDDGESVGSHSDGNRRGGSDRAAGVGGGDRDVFRDEKAVLLLPDFPVGIDAPVWVGASEGTRYGNRAIGNAHYNLDGHISAHRFVCLHLPFFARAIAAKRLSHLFIPEIEAGQTSTERTRARIDAYGAIMHMLCLHADGSRKNGSPFDKKEEEEDVGGEDEAGEGGAGGGPRDRPPRGGADGAPRGHLDPNGASRNKRQRSSLKRNDTQSAVRYWFEYKVPGATGEEAKVHALPMRSYGIEFLMDPDPSPGDESKPSCVALRLWLCTLDEKFDDWPGLSQQLTENLNRNRARHYTPGSTSSSSSTSAPSGVVAVQSREEKVRVRYLKSLCDEQHWSKALLLYKGLGEDHELQGGEASKSLKLEKASHVLAPEFLFDPRRNPQTLTAGLYDENGKPILIRADQSDVRSYFPGLLFRRQVTSERVVVHGQPREICYHFERESRTIGEWGNETTTVTQEHVPADCVRKVIQYHTATNPRRKVPHYVAEIDSEAFVKRFGQSTLSKYRGSKYFRPRLGPMTSVLEEERENNACKWQQVVTKDGALFEVTVGMTRRYGRRCVVAIPTFDALGFPILGKDVRWFSKVEQRTTRAPRPRVLPAASGEGSSSFYPADPRPSSPIDRHLHLDMDVDDDVNAPHITDDEDEDVPCGAGRHSFDGEDIHDAARRAGLRRVGPRQETRYALNCYTHIGGSQDSSSYEVSLYTPTADLGDSMAGTDRGGEDEEDEEDEEDGEDEEDVEDEEDGVNLRKVPHYMLAKPSAATRWLESVGKSNVKVLVPVVEPVYQDEVPKAIDAKRLLRIPPVVSARGLFHFLNPYAGAVYDRFLWTDLPDMPYSRSNVPDALLETFWSHRSRTDLAFAKLSWDSPQIGAAFHRYMKGQGSVGEVTRSDEQLRGYRESAGYSQALTDQLLPSAVDPEVLWPQRRWRAEHKRVHRMLVDEGRQRDRDETRDLRGFEYNHAIQKRRANRSVVLKAFREFAISRVQEMLSCEASELPPGLVTGFQQSMKFLNSDECVALNRSNDAHRKVADLPYDNLSTFGELQAFMQAFVVHVARPADEPTGFLYQYYASFERFVDTPKFVCVSFGQAACGKSETARVLAEVLLPNSTMSGGHDSSKAGTHGRAIESGFRLTYDEIPPFMLPAIEKLDPSHREKMKELVTSSSVTSNTSVEVQTAEGKRYVDQRLLTEHQEKIFVNSNMHWLAGVTSSELSEGQRAWLSRIVFLFARRRGEMPGESYREILESNPLAQERVARLRRLESYTVQLLICQNIVPAFGPPTAHVKQLWKRLDAALERRHGVPPLPDDRVADNRLNMYRVVATHYAAHVTFCSSTSAALAARSKGVDLTKFSFDHLALAAHAMACPPNEVAVYAWMLSSYARIGIAPVFDATKRALLNALNHHPMRLGNEIDPSKTTNRGPEPPPRQDDVGRDQILGPRGALMDIVETTRAPRKKRNADGSDVLGSDGNPQTEPWDEPAKRTTSLGDFRSIVLYERPFAEVIRNSTDPNTGQAGRLIRKREGELLVVFHEKQRLMLRRTRTGKGLTAAEAMMMLPTHGQISQWYEPSAIHEASAKAVQCVMRGAEVVLPDASEPVKKVDGSSARAFSKFEGELPKPADDPADGNAAANAATARRGGGGGGGGGGGAAPRRVSRRASNRVTFAVKPHPQGDAYGAVYDFNYLDVTPALGGTWTDVGHELEKLPIARDQGLTADTIAAALKLISLEKFSCVASSTVGSESAPGQNDGRDGVAPPSSTLTNVLARTHCMHMHSLRKYILGGNSYVQHAHDAAVRRGQFPVLDPMTKNLSSDTETEIVRPIVFRRSGESEEPRLLVSTQWLQQTMLSEYLAALANRRDPQIGNYVDPALRGCGYPFDAKNGDNLPSFWASRFHYIHSDAIRSVLWHVEGGPDIVTPIANPMTEDVPLMISLDRADPRMDVQRLERRRRVRDMQLQFEKERRIRLNTMLPATIKASDEVVALNPEDGSEDEEDERADGSQDKIPARCHGHRPHVATQRMGAVHMGRPVTREELEGLNRGGTTKDAYVVTLANKKRSDPWITYLMSVLSDRGLDAQSNDVDTGKMLLELRSCTIRRNVRKKASVDKQVVLSDAFDNNGDPLPSTQSNGRASHDAAQFAEDGLRKQAGLKDLGTRDVPGCSDEYPCV